MPTIIPKQTAAKTETRSIASDSVPVSVQVDGDLASETIAVNLIGINGTDTTAYTVDGTTYTFSADNTILTFYGPCDVQFVKGVTTNAVGLKLVN
jgi:hypothetical protein